MSDDFAQIRCLWCCLPIENFNNTGHGRKKKHKIHTNGKCYANLVVYENEIRQLQAYLKTLTPKRLSRAKNMLLKYDKTEVLFSATEISFGRSKMKNLVLIEEKTQKVKPFKL